MVVAIQYVAKPSFCVSLEGQRALYSQLADPHVLLVELSTLPLA